MDLAGTRITRSVTGDVVRFADGGELQLTLTLENELPAKVGTQAEALPMN